jgi:DNA adenine methylase
LARLSNPKSALGEKPKAYKPLPPMFKYFGGKSKVAKKIVKMIPEHKTWVEPFAGGASVTLAKPQSEKEVLADKRADVVNFYRHIKNGRDVRIPPVSKHRFDEIRHKPESNRSPGEFLLLQSKSFGGHGQSYADGSSSRAVMLRKRADEYWQRLRKMTLLNSDFQRTMRRYDSTNTAFYLDPPYPVTKNDYTDYGREIPPVQTMRQTVEKTKGKVILSYPDTPEVRKAFPERRYTIRRFRLYRPLTSYNQGPRTRSELLIFNYNPSTARKWQGLEGLAG